MTLPTAVPPCPDLAVHDLRAQAATLRREADAIDAEMRAIQAYDRADVWQGGRATAFREGLLDQVRRLCGPGSGVSDALRHAALRIDQRADALAAPPQEIAGC
jgi:hypothetical protein